MRLLYNWHDYRFRNSSNAYNRHEQNRAISSAETQVSIADETMKSAVSGLTFRVNALVTAANNYVDQMNEIASKSPDGSSLNYLSAADNSEAPKSKADSSVENADYRDEASLSKASNFSASSASVGKVLVSLKSNVGTIYSLVNERNSSNRN